ncbi:MAG: hypothetical protein J6Y69_10235 [Treponema sp.]|nr:hypothetical protein [Treponema sp.]
MLDGKFENAMYRKGYNDGYADGMARSDTLLAESIANYIIVNSIMGKRSFMMKELCRHFGINEPYMDGLVDDVRGLVNTQLESTREKVYNNSIKQ